MSINKIHRSVSYMRHGSAKKKKICNKMADWRWKETTVSSKYENQRTSGERGLATQRREEASSDESWPPPRPRHRHGPVQPDLTAKNRDAIWESRKGE
jgi:hypothetical protein